jgi:hypothetical protein
VLTTAFEKKGDSLADYGGLLIALAELWDKAWSDASLQQNILAVSAFDLNSTVHHVATGDGI